MVEEIEFKASFFGKHGKNSFLWAKEKESGERVDFCGW